MKLLIIEDDKNLSDSIAANLSCHYDIDQAFDGEEGLYLAQSGIYDGIVLDIMLPLMNGYQVLSELRRGNLRTPVLLLTAKDGIDDKVAGFERGADDYLVKPFHREELLLRMQALIRRAGGEMAPDQRTFRDLTLSTASRTVAVSGKALDLQGKQFDMLEYLIANRNMIVTKEQIFDRIWGFDSDTTANVVEVYASHLRKALKTVDYDGYLRTIRGMGYMLSDGEK